MKCILLTYAILGAGGGPEYPSYMPHSVLRKVQNELRTLFRKSYGLDREVHVDPQERVFDQCEIVGTYSFQDDAFQVDWTNENKKQSEVFLLSDLLQGRARLKDTSTNSLKMADLKRASEKHNFQELSLSHTPKSQEKYFWIGLGAVGVVGGFLLWQANQSAVAEKNTASRGKIKRRSLGLAITF